MIAFPTSRYGTWKIQTGYYLYSELPEDKVFNINESEFKNTQNLFEEFTKTITLVGFNFSYRINKRQKSKTKSSLVEPRHEKAIKEKNDTLKKFQKTNNQEEFIRLKHLRTKSKCLIKSSRKSLWKNPLFEKTLYNEFLLSIYNRIWRNEGSWSKKWKSGTIIPILEPDKNQLKPDKYRPITLLNTMCKYLKK